MNAGEGQTDNQDGGIDNFFNEGRDEPDDLAVDIAEATTTTELTNNASRAADANLPPPPVTGQISWTGLATPETAIAETAPAETPAAAETPVDTEKKVVWSSTPTKGYSSFGSGTRRDDY